LKQFLLQLDIKIEKRDEETFLRLMKKMGNAAREVAFQL
jgi:hypothetical protein